MLKCPQTRAQQQRNRIFNLMDSDAKSGNTRTITVIASFQDMHGDTCW